MNVDKIYLFSKNDLRRIISILTDLSYSFRDSISLKQVGGNRNNTMMSRIHSYAGMFCYLYETYGYGKATEILDLTMMNHYTLVITAMNNTYNRNDSIRQLSDNWADILNTIMIIEMAKLSDAFIFIQKEADIEFVTKAMEKWSGKVCVRPKNITYNPYNISENPSMAAGHSIPDLSDVFANELLPQLLSAHAMVSSQAEIIRNFVLSMLKSYRDNAGYVPMCIVDTLCQQIGNIATRAGVTYPSFSNLREYVLDKIYK
jgi:hypothetical protein